ncbi:efflux RND transporter periplasmic adaptor subunit [Fodinibius sp.]|uniref:efflux RND transporter periplasmic adaptor subunit n=1 Tax=Fodinibius sp. TaxID=1872440 RepID=UPI002ACDD65C|nr:efflux RND transporter periplasmic adaptor subunit [Fodinibius sp.]MDZ7659572.1 efflux RND transporter periplasmic adaptor subunit [Fodinibius sp.]
MKSPNINQIGRSAGILVIGLLLGWLFFGGSSADQPQSMDEHVKEAHTNEQGEVVYTCSMHPSVRQSEPGNCPICGMELIPADEEGSEQGSEASNYELKMTEAAARLAEVQTTEVIKDVAVKKVRMPGKIAVDERRVSNVTAHFPGRITQLYVDYTGARIQKGERLASIYSPQLLSAQRELLETRKHKKSNPALYQSTRRKLELWELPEEEIQKIENSGKVINELDIVSPAEGYVLKRNISEQDHVMEGTVMYEIANLSKVWVTFEAYESDLVGLAEGNKVTFTVEAYPGETFEAEITYIDPTLDPQSRTATVRAEAANPDRRLKPQMLAEGVVSSEISGGKEQTLIPKSAVLWTGERSVVYVYKRVDGQPVFEFREVELGARVGDQYVVKSGVKVGEEVVTNGNFKIDSAAQLAGKASMMNRNPDGTKPAGHNHGSMEEMNRSGESSEMDNQSHEEATTDTSDHQHSEHLSELIDNYLAMKEALANDRFKEAKNHLEAFKKEVTESKEMNEHPEHSDMHQKHHAAMVEAVNNASEAKTIDKLRESFAEISNQLVKAVENQGFDTKELYWQYCPMAQNQEGAYWLDDKKAISNPYMGQQMPGCGSTEKVISKSK